MTSNEENASPPSGMALLERQSFGQALAKIVVAVRAKRLDLDTPSGHDNRRMLRAESWKLLEATAIRESRPEDKGSDEALRHAVFAMAATCNVVAENLGWVRKEEAK